MERGRPLDLTRRQGELIDANDARVQPRVQAVLAYTQTLAVAAAGGDGGLH